MSKRWMSQWLQWLLFTKTWNGIGYRDMAKGNFAIRGYSFFTKPLFTQKENWT